MAATATSSATSELLAHCTGRFDYALPSDLAWSGGQQKIYLLKVSLESLQGHPDSSPIWKRQLGTTLAETHVESVPAVPAREFDLRGVGPAAWLHLSPKRPDLVTLLAMKPMPDANLALFLRAEASAGREPIAEGVVTNVAASYVPGSPQGFCTGPGAFVIAPSVNERASASFTAHGLEVSVETETAKAPDDGQSTEGELPAGSSRLMKQTRSVGGFDGIEEHVRIVDGHDPVQIIYTWIFAGHAADGAAPRIRLMAAAMEGQSVGLDPAWNALLASWRLRPVGTR